MKSATLPIDTAPVMETVTLQRQPHADDMAGLIERLARDVDVDKLERLIAMRDRAMGQQAESLFNAAFTAMQPEIPTIIERARTDKTPYAPLEDIIEVIRPIYSRHGFSLGFQTEWPNEKTVKVIGILTHIGGHARRSEFISAPDQTGSKNAIQALGSAVAYGKRYTTKDLFCIVTREEDDDGKKAHGKPELDAPEGYDDWLDDLAAAADNGWDTFKQAWNPAAVQPFRDHLARTKPGHSEKLKLKAKDVTARGAK